MGYETSDATVYRQGTAGNAQRTWRGFVTDERRVINHLIAELEQSVTSPPDPGQWYLAATADDDARYDATRTAALAAAQRDGTGLVLYDRTTESWLTTPYPRGPWSDDDDAMSAAWRMTPERLDSLGRRYLADQVRAARRAGVAAVAHMADDTGADALLEAIDRYKPSVVFLPSHLSEPSLLDRVRGNTIAALTRDVVATVQIVDLDQSVRDG